MKKKIIDWNPRKDPYLKEGEIEVHEKIHQHRYENKIYTLNKGRLKLLEEFEGLIKKTIDGNVLEIGAGDGSVSVFLSQNRNVNKIYSMECNLPAVDNLIRSNFIKNKVNEEKYELVLGSFNNIEKKNYFDYVIALGVLHHSGNLLRTMKSIYNSLKPNGFLIAQEPYMPDTTPNRIFLEKEEQEKNVQGLVTMKEKNRDDHFFRKCEYLTAFYHAGFDVVFLDKPELKKGSVMNSLIILKKPDIIYHKVPHSWF